MIRASGKDANGRLVIFLGVTPVNIRYLRDGKPIAVDLKAFGLDGQIIIAFGESEEGIEREIRSAGVQIHEYFDLRNSPKA